MQSIDLDERQRGMLIAGVDECEVDDGLRKKKGEWQRRRIQGARDERSARLGFSTAPTKKRRDGGWA